MKKKSSTWIYPLVMTGVLFIFTNSCTKDNSTSPSGQIPVLTTSDVNEITQNTANCGGNITSDGRTTITTRGVCWNTSQEPTISDAHTIDGNGTGSFTSNITGLTANTSYYVRAYATNGVGTAYGSQVNFITQQGTVPTVITSSITNITETSATADGNVTSQGSSPVTARGICWSTSSNPTISGTHKTDGSGTGGFTSNITGLTSNTPYYVRAYATNSSGTGYGNQVNFTTTGSGTVPTVTTNSLTNITQTTATCGGNVTVQGSSSVTARGVCWSIYSTPTTSFAHTTDGSGTGVFTSNLTGLISNTPYYVRAYATNSAGTAYGNQVSFTTSGAFNIGQNYGGGIIFYIDNTGQHGLIAATSDQSTGATWGCETILIGTSDSIGSGHANTTAIVNGCSTTGIAAQICDALVLNGYSDWFLPSSDELNQMYLQRTVIGGFASANYWSSSEYAAYGASILDFSNGGLSGNLKYFPYYVRAVRSF